MADIDLHNQVFMVLDILFIFSPVLMHVIWTVHGVWGCVSVCVRVFVGVLVERSFDHFHNVISIDFRCHSKFTPHSLTRTPILCKLITKFPFYLHKRDFITTRCNLSLTVVVVSHTIILFYFKCADCNWMIIWYQIFIYSFVVVFADLWL